MKRLILVGAAKMIVFLTHITSNLFRLTRAGPRLTSTSLTIEKWRRGSTNNMPKTSDYLRDCLPFLYTSHFIIPKKICPNNASHRYYALSSIIQYLLIEGMRSINGYVGFKLQKYENFPNRAKWLWDINVRQKWDLGSTKTNTNMRAGMVL